jgi:hypothetical protein
VSLSFLLGCQTYFSTKAEIPNFAGYLISGLQESGSFTSNTLVIFNPNDFSVIKKASLPASKIDTAGIAPSGALWLGLSGGSNSDDDRVIVLNTAGDQIAEIHACLNPTSGIWFYKDKAYVVCRADGFSAVIVAINTSTFKVEGSPINIAMENLAQDPFLVTGSALLGQYLAVTGTVTGADEQATYSALAIVDLETNSISEKIQLGAGTDIWDILPYKGNFYLLNPEGVHNTEKADLIIIDPKQNKIIKSVSLQTHSPLFGAISNDTLYSYQNGEWDTSLVSPERSICTTKLTDYSQSCVSLPDGFAATSFELINNLPCIAHWGSNTSDAGLYCLVNGKLELKVESEETTIILMKHN